MREAVARRDAVIDHFLVRRQHRDLDGGDRVRRDALGDQLMQRLRRRHGLARRAPRLERHLVQREFAEAATEDREVRRQAVDVLQKLAVGELHVGREPGLRGQRRLQAARRRMADREPARRGDRGMMASAWRQHDQCGRERAGGFASRRAAIAATRPPRRRAAPRSMSARCRDRARSVRRSRRRTGSSSRSRRQLRRRDRPASRPPRSPSPAPPAPRSSPAWSSRRDGCHPPPRAASARN